ncbi:MAG: hypothetical protein F6K24_52225 [Okeania sp. SIO2D1]|nr:hypothetical protein [Okeania sp. SIO2D1]
MIGIHPGAPLRESAGINANISISFLPTKVSHLLRWTLVGRDITLRRGVGKVLKFNSGDYNPDTALGTYELPIQEAMRKHLKSGDVFYDLMSTFYVKKDVDKA